MAVSEEKEVTHGFFEKEGCSSFCACRCLCLRSYHLQATKKALQVLYVEFILGEDLLRLSNYVHFRTQKPVTCFTSVHSGLTWFDFLFFICTPPQTPLFWNLTCYVQGCLMLHRPPTKKTKNKRLASFS